MITATQLKNILFRANEADIEKYLPYLNKFFPLYGIETPDQQAAFIAQIGHESGHLRYVEENLNYSADALRRVFGKYFPTDEDARQYAYQPEKIANKVYANRMGNGRPETGDGWKYRGRGLLQITGKSNYRNMGKSIGIDLVTCPGMLIMPEYAVQSACCWWQSHDLNSLCGTGSEGFKKITKAINGGYNGLTDRAELWERAKKVLI